MGGLGDDIDDNETLILISGEDVNPKEFELLCKAASMSNLVAAILEGGK